MSKLSFLLCLFENNFRPPCISFLTLFPHPHAIFRCSDGGNMSIIKSQEVFEFFFRENVTNLKIINSFFPLWAYLFGSNYFKEFSVAKPSGVLSVTLLSHAG